MMNTVKPDPWKDVPVNTVNMITGQWARTKIICGRHEDEQVELVLRENDGEMFYACPKYYDANREPGEKPCFNRLSIGAFEKMLEEIAHIEIEAEENDEEINLTNYKWERNGIQFTVIKYTPQECVIMVLNKKSISRGA